MGWATNHNVAQNPKNWQNDYRVKNCVSVDLFACKVGHNGCNDAVMFDRPKVIQINATKYIESIRKGYLCFPVCDIDEPQGL